MFVIATPKERYQNKAPNILLLLWQWKLFRRVFNSITLSLPSEPILENWPITGHPAHEVCSGPFFSKTFFNLRWPKADFLSAACLPGTEPIRKTLTLLKSCSRTIFVQSASWWALYAARYSSKSCLNPVLDSPSVALSLSTKYNGGCYL